LNKYLFVISLFISFQVYAHGEDKFGPNGGYIRMPANFHTEVVKINAKKIQVYLLDIQFKNPTVQNSDVTGSHYIAHSEYKLNCRAKKKKYFECISKTALLEGHLKISARRNDKTSYDAYYPLPLRLEEKSNTANTPAVSTDNTKSKEHHQHH
jgi:hypothetical protein